MSIYEYDEERHMRQEREASREEGIEKGIEYNVQLTKLLLETGRVEDLKRAVDDKDFCRKLYKEFSIF